MKKNNFASFIPFCPYCLNSFELKNFILHVPLHKEFSALRRKPVFCLFENSVDSKLLNFKSKQLRTFSVVFLLYVKKMITYSSFSELLDSKNIVIKEWDIQYFIKCLRSFFNAELKLQSKNTVLVTVDIKSKKFVKNKKTNNFIGQSNLFCPLCMKNTESLYYHRFGECGHGLSISDNQAKFIDDNIYIFARKYALNIFYAAFIVYLKKKVSVREIQKILQEKGLSYRHTASNWDALETVLKEIFNSSLDVEIPDGGNLSSSRIYYCKPVANKKMQRKGPNPLYDAGLTHSYGTIIHIPI